MLARAVITVSISVTAVLFPVVASAAPSETVSVIVVLQPGADVAAEAHALASAHGGRAATTFTEVLGGFQFVGPAEGLTGLRRSSRVRSVVEDATFELVDSAGWGFFRIDADLAILDPAGPYRGVGTRVAVIDSGVDLDHPDLASNIDQAAGYNCVSPGAPPDDDHSHGTHVAGIAAANFDGAGAAGVAPEARIVPLKAFDATGNGTTAQIICALDRLAGVVRSSPAPTVVNMSFADAGTDSVCDDGDTSDVLHEALCDLVDVGESVGSAVVPVAAAGNAAEDAASTVPAAFHDVITVSALTDLDGIGGGAAGCTFTPTSGYECDDMLASFSNFGAVVDVAAPGVEVWSTVPGGWDVKSGTSMAAPHVTGVVALMLGENTSLDTAGVRSLLAQSGECPDGTVAGSDRTCANQGQWQQTGGFFEILPDPDGIPEPLVNAARAATAAAAGGDPPAPDLPPTVHLISPGEGAIVSGPVTVSADASDDRGVASVAFSVDGSSIGFDTDGGDGWSAPWDTTTVIDGIHDVGATATDTTGQTTTSTVTVSVENGTAAAPTLHVANLIGTTTSGRKWTATVTAVIQDAGGAAVAGATVTFDLTNGSGASASVTAKPGGGGGGGGGTPTTLSCVTDSTGRCAVSTKPPGTTITFSVRSVEKAGWVRDPSADAVTSITLAK